MMTHHHKVEAPGHLSVRLSLTLSVDVKQSFNLCVCVSETDEAAHCTGDYRTANGSKKK